MSWPLVPQAVGRRFLPCLVLGLAGAAPAWAARLPLQSHTTADGLAHDRVESIVQDSRHFLWFGTPEGLSRFDGYRFATLGRESGLPRATVRALVEVGGDYWVATEDGVCSFRTATAGCEPRPLDGDPQSRHVNALVLDAKGRLWAGTDAGLFQTDPDRRAFKPVSPIPPRGGAPRRILALAPAADGSVWFGGPSGLGRARADGQVVHYTVERYGGDPIFALLVEAPNRLWVGSRSGLMTMAIPSSPEVGATSTLRLAPTGCEKDLVALRPGQACLVRPGRGPARNVRAFARSADGTIWAGLQNAGLLELANGTIRRYTTDDGLASNAVRSLFEDQDQNLWIGTEGRGVSKLARKGLVSYGRDDGLANTRIVSVFGDARGGVYVHGAGGLLQRFDGSGWFSSVRPLRRGVRGPFGPGQSVVRPDSAGSWWLGTGAGLFRLDGVRDFNSLETLRPTQWLSADPDGAPAPAGPVLEDARHDIWAGAVVQRQPVLLHWERATDRLATTDLAERAPGMSRVCALGEDRTGAIWIGLTQGGLLRLRHGHVEAIAFAERPLAAVRAFHLDPEGRLWLAADNAGLGRIDRPAADHPEARWWGRAEGLSSDVAFCLAEDRWRRVYVGTSLGVTRLDPATGRTRQYGTADGLAAGEVRSAYADTRGRLWFGTVDGVSVLTPALEPAAPAPRAYISSLRVGGIPRPLSVLGERAVGGIELAANQAEVEIEYASLSFGLGDRLRYRYRLQGADRDWSDPTDRRTVSYARLAPGSYRFLVQAMNADGALSTEPASVSFDVRAPVWKRWWFGATAALLALLVAYAGFRYRLGMLLEVERVRLRVASDLHDDIGSNLSKIAILSEVALRQEPAAREAALAGIADTARQLVDSMSDIVWAVNPRRDSLGDLAQRMRAFASDLFSALDVTLRFHAPAGTDAVPIGAELRREVFLIFKEAVTNAANHSGCTRVEVDLGFERGLLTLRVTDDGHGFDPVAASDGHGLHSLRDRARVIRGEMEVRSEPGRGTTVLLRAPGRTTGATRAGSDAALARG